jgi:antiviral helicase SLH1
METAARIRSITPKAKGITVQAFNSTTDFSKFTTTKRFIGVFAPTYLLGLEDSVFHSYAKRLSLLLLEDLHLLDEQYELITARLLATLRPARTRVVGLTSSLNDAADLGAWLGVDPGSTYSFQPRDRGNTLLTSVKTFSQPHSATLLKLMVKPAYDLIKASPDSGTIVFVPSRNACRTVATDMVTQSGTEMDLSGFLTTPRENVEPLLSRLRDPALFEPLLHGIGFIVPGGSPADLALVLELFASGVIRALIVPREACWTLPVRAPSVVIMGCQYTLFTGDDSDRRVVNYSRTELVRMQGFAMPSAHHLSPGGRLWVMCQAEQAMIITRVLNDGLPLESNLPALLKRNHPVVPDESVLGVNRMLKYRPPPPISRPGMKRMTDPRKRDMMDMLNWTYLARRIRSNPTYYDVHKGTEADGMSRLVDEWFRTSGEEYAPTPSMESVSAFGPRSRSDSDSWSVSITPSMSASVARGRDYDVRTMADDDDDRMEELAGESEVDGEVRDVSRVGMSDGERLGTPAVPVE